MQNMTRCFIPWILFLAISRFQILNHTAIRWWTAQIYELVKGPNGHILSGSFNHLNSVTNNFMMLPLYIWIWTLESITFYASWLNNYSLWPCHMCGTLIGYPDQLEVKICFTLLIILSHVLYHTQEEWSFIHTINDNHSTNEWLMPRTFFNLI